MEAALWAFAASGEYREGALLAVNLGHDADTVGAIYGQLAGAHYGASGIPESWLDILHERAVIADLAGGLAHLGVQLPISPESRRCLG